MVTNEVAAGGGERPPSTLCFGCGHQNPRGLHLEFEVQPNLARTHFRPSEEHQGFPGLMHGGLAATLIDEAMGWAMYQAGAWAMTGRLELRFRKPVPIGRELRVEARVMRNRGRALTARGQIADEATGDVLVESDALFMRLSEDEAEQMAAIYRAAGSGEASV